MFLACAGLTAAAYGVPALVFAVYYYFFFTGAQTTKIECKTYLGTLVSDVLAGTHRAALYYLLFLLDAPLPLCLVAAFHFVLPCAMTLLRAVVTAVNCFTVGPRAAAQKSVINVALWQRVLRGILSGGKDGGSTAQGAAASRYAQVNSGKGTSGATRKTSLCASNVECQILDEGNQFNRVARGCLLS